MRILIVNTVSFDRNGISNVISNLLSAMDGKDMTADLFAVNDPPEAVCRLFRQRGGQIYVTPRQMRHPFRRFHALWKVLKEGRHDLVHIHGNSATLVLELGAAFLAGCKVRIVHGHNTMCNSLLLHRLLQPLFGCLCTHRLACGSQAGAFMYGKRPFTVVKNGIRLETFAYDAEKRKAIRQQYGLQDRIVIGHVGYFNPVKNQTFLVDILRKLHEKDSRYCLLLVGQGELQQSVREKAARLGLESDVILAGGTDQVEAYLSAFDLVVMPSLHEGLPLTLIEQQANGLKAVVSDTIPREADQTGSLTFLPLAAGAETWAHRVMELSLPEDRQEASEAARETLRQQGYDILTEAAKLKEYYLQATGLKS